MSSEKIRPIAFYLPQYHDIPENDEWWGKGFTEWTNLKKAKPLFQNHYQPRVPLNDNYYDLLDPTVQVWQSELAQKYGIYGFCYYHYWFGGHMLLQKPAENMLINPAVTIPFCFSWANENWTKAWVSDKNQVLISQTYGTKKEWIDHFQYLLQFFKDPRYIKENNKPLFIIYRPELIDCCEEMMECWKEEAIKNGFSGMLFGVQHRSYYLSSSYNPQLFDYEIEYQPGFSSFGLNQKFKFLRKIKRSISLFLEKRFHVDTRFSINQKLTYLDYDQIWNSILNYRPVSDKACAGAFMDWDNTPRRGKKGSVCLGSTPEKFEKNLKEEIAHIHHFYPNSYLFIFAWNEWTEGGYLEPDKKYGYQYLQALKKALESDD